MTMDGPDKNKNLRRCKNCEEVIQKSLIECPNCGFDQRSFIMKYKWFFIIIIIGLIYFYYNSKR